MLYCGRKTRRRRELMRGNEYNSGTKKQKI
jgi:hypothetical protein